MKHTHFQPQSLLSRGVTALFGLFFVILGIGIPFFTSFTLGVVVVSLVLGILGIDALVSAYTNKASLLSYIGPLP